MKSKTTYYTVIIPYTEINTTIWHPTDKDFAPLTRGSFKTNKEAKQWAEENLNNTKYKIKKITY